MLDLFKVFFLLGLISFGGPAAHIGYFRTTFVEKRNWLTDQEYAQLIALSQFLPGPSSSQIGFAIGYQRAGVLGGILAFLGFTLPSITLMIIIATLTATFLQSDIWQSLVYGLKLLAVVVVADATLSMYRNFCQTKLTSAFCIFTACTALLIPSIASQMACLILAAIGGVLLLPSEKNNQTSNNRSLQQSKNHHQWIAAILFCFLFFVLPWLVSFSPLVQLFSEFFQAGSLVFGGGHVVLPLLQNTVAEQISPEQLLTGYATAQAVPGPMFTFATYLGYFLLPNTPIIGSLIATLAVFLPGFLLVILFYRHWTLLAEKPLFIKATSGINASVVGLLLAALYQPVFINAVSESLDIVVVILGFFTLRMLKLPILYLIIAFILFGTFVN